MANKKQLRQQQLEMITAWQQSGQNQQQYCLENNISYHKFHYWYRVYRYKQTADNGSFVTLNVTPAAQGNVELHFADGKRIIFHQPVCVEYLKALIV